MLILALYAGAYLLGSIPFAVILGKLKGVDVLKSTSGNPGMTNVWRMLGPSFGILCFVLDVSKSLVPTLIARSLIQERHGPFDPQFIWFTVGVAAVVGHSISPFLHFKGGKGVSSALGVILGASPLVGLSCFSTFLVVLLVSGYVSMASMIGVCSIFAFTFIYPNQTVELLPVYLLISIFVIYRHRKNLERIKAGTEPKLRFNLVQAFRNRLQGQGKQSDSVQ